MEVDKYKINYEDRFLEEKKFLVEKFGYFFGKDLESIISWIQKRPIPPQVPEWHRLKEFCNNKMIVGARAIIEDNRIVYEFIPSKKLIIFTNCLDHLYRDTTYYHNLKRSFSDTYPRLTKLMQEIFDAEDNENYESSYKLSNLIDTAIEHGYCEVENLKVVSDEKGIRIYDKVHNEITYVKRRDNEFYLFTE